MANQDTEKEKEGSEQGWGLVSDGVSSPNVPGEAVSRPNPSRTFLNRPLRWLVLICYVGIFAILFYGGREANKTCNNRVQDWFPSEFPETQKLIFFNNHFVSNEMVLISWDGLKPEDPKQDELKARFLSSPGTDPEGKPLPPLVRRVYSTRELLHQMDELNAKRYARQTPPKPIRELSMDQLEGWLLSRDRTQGGIVVMPSAAGAADRPALLEKLYADTMELTGLTHTQIHLAGATCDSVAIDETTKSSQSRLLPIFGVICAILLFFCLKNPILSVSVLFISAMNEEIGPAAIFYSGSHMDSISLLVAALTFVLTMESGIHLANYYRDSVLEGGTKGAVWRTLEKGWLPCFLATFTTILGMGSLAVSYVTPICNFGIYTSISLFSGMCLLFLYVASCWENWPPFEYWMPFWKRKTDPLLREMTAMKCSAENGPAGEKAIGVSGVTEGVARNRSMLRWEMLARFISKTYWGVIGACIVLIGIFSFFVPFLDTSITLHGMLRPTHEVIVDYDYLEERFGGLVPINVILRIPKNEANVRRTPLEEMNLISLIQNELAKVPGIDGCTSVLSVLPALPSLTDPSTAARSARRVFNREMDENVGKLQESNYFFDAPEERMWLLTLRIPAGANLKYEPLLQEVELRIYETLRKNGVTYAISEKQLLDAPFLADARRASGPEGLLESFQARETVFGELKQRGEETLTRQERRALAEAEMMRFQEVSCVVTGAIPLVFKAQQQLLKDLIVSFMTAFILILFTMIVLLRSVCAGLIAILPNILPSIVIFGILAALEIKIDIGTMMTASVALGITVDGTLHFLTWFQRGIALGYDRKNAVLYAYSNCAGAMVQTAFICSFTFLVFVFSDFMPVARFAWMLCVLLTAAIIADLFLTPALLISPLGKFFVRKGDLQKNRSRLET
ncbi:MAG: MMPL family transporter [Thermoguttaceae bacterium]|nr:MMPL family transporter [Thermoguttaceae bacterium]